VNRSIGTSASISYAQLFAEESSGLSGRLGSAVLQMGGTILHAEKPADSISFTGMGETGLMDWTSYAADWIVGEENRE